MFAAAAKRTALAVATVAALTAVSVVGAAGGASQTNDQTPPTAPGNLHVTAATQSTVSIAWDASSDDRGVVGYYVYGDGLRTRSLGTQYSVTGLECGQSVYIAVEAYDRAGNRSPRASTTVSTSPCYDAWPPAAPTGFHQIATDQNSVVLGWNPSTDNVGVVRYGVYRLRLAVASPSEPNVTLTGLSCGSSAQFEVDAVDAAGNRSTRSSVWVQTSDCPTTTPTTPTTPPTNPTPTPTTDWTLCADENKTCSFTGTKEVRYGANGVYTAVRTFSAPFLCANSVFGDPLRGTFKHCDVRDPVTTAPTNPTPTPTTDWTLCADENKTCSFTGTKEVRYGANGVYTAVRTFSAPFLCANSVFGDPLRGTFKHCDVRDPAPTNPTTPTTPEPTPPAPTGDSVAPTPPASLTVTAASSASVSLDWAPSTDNVGVTAYDVSVNGASGPSVGQTDATVSGLTCGLAYDFEVEARDAANNHSDPAAVTSSTRACADTQTPTAPAGVVATSRTATSIALSWSPASDNVGVAGYGLFRGGVQQDTTTGTTGIYSGLTCNTNYTLAVDAYDAAGNRSAKTTLMVSTTACPDTTPPSQPTGLAVSNVSQTGLTLSWTPSTDNVGVSQYDVYKGGSKVATVSSASNALTGLTCATSYSLGVVARDAAGNSSAQAATTGTTSACTTPTPTTGWAFCANENQQCTFAGTKEVQYGANGTFTTPRTFSSPVLCANSVFGDPLNGVVKRCEFRDVSSTGSPAPAPAPAPTPTPTSGQALSDFSAFKNNVFTQTFQNRWKAPPSTVWTTLGQTGQPWDDGSGVFESSTPYGPGFRIVQNESVPRGSGALVGMADIDHFVDQQNYLGTVTDLSGKVMFPRSGNPNGFPAFGDWNILWEFTQSTVVHNVIGVDATAPGGPTLYVRAFDPANAGNRDGRKARMSSPIQYDRWYDWHWQIKWSTGSDGYVNFWVDGQQIAAFRGPSVMTSGGPPYLEWGWYGGYDPGRNEVRYAALRKS